MIESIAAFDGRMAKVTGPARSGKTEALVRRCATLIESGADPSSILVETSCATAAQSFRARLGAALPEGRREAADAVVVRTALESCVAVLSSPEAIEATGRTPRLLTSAEYNFFLEDMKTLGMPIRRLRGMLSFFYQQWSDLVPEENWLVGEEREVADHALRHLKARGAMLVQEAPALCVAFLKSDAGESARQSFTHVLCDDFQSLSRAEQTLLCLLAKDQILVAGNPNEVTHGKHADPEGFVKFDALRRGVESFVLTGCYASQAAARMANGLCDKGSMDPSLAATTFEGAPGSALSIKWNAPEDEINGITKYLRTLFDGSDALESRTCIVVPNKRWARMVEKVLRQRGFNVSASLATAGIGGDPRHSVRAKALVAYTKLNLLAHPEDMTAWRSLCGFDNHLTNSDAWMFLLDWADENGLSAYEALEKAAACTEDPFPRAKAVIDPFKAGREFIEKNAPRRGFALLRAIGAEGIPEFSDVASMLQGDEDALRVYEMARSMATDPTCPEDARTIHLASLTSLANGGDYDNVFFLGCIDGFMPRRDAFEVVSTDEERAAVLDTDRMAFYRALCKANDRVVFSTFSKAALEIAELTKMQVVRVKSESGQRIAILRPSTFYGEIGESFPSTVGGQAFMADLGLN